MTTVEIGLAVAGAPALVGMLAIEIWRRRTVRRLRLAERRERARRAGWDGLRAVDEATRMDEAA